MPDHVLRYTTRPGYGNLPTRQMQLTAHKSDSLHPSAATSRPEHCGLTRIQPSKMFTHQAPATVTPLATSCC